MTERVRHRHAPFTAGLATVDTKEPLVTIEALQI